MSAFELLVERHQDRIFRLASAWLYAPDAAADEAPRRAATGQRLERALERIAALPERQREVVLLRIFEDMSVEDTARTLGCRPGTVKAQLSRALGRLRALENDHE